MDDIERLKDLRDQLRDIGGGSHKAWLNQDYCKEMADILERQIDKLEDSAEFVTFWHDKFTVNWPSQDDLF